MLTTLLLAVGPFASALDVVSPYDVVVARSKHYEVHSFVSGPPADDLCAMLELAWKEYAAFLRARPPSSQGGKLFLIRVLPDRSSWVEALRASAPAGFKLENPYYVPALETVFVEAQLTVNETRRKVLEGAFRQFHFNAKRKHRDMQNEWFVRGAALHFAMHLWDGECLRLGHRYVLRPPGVMAERAAALIDADEYHGSPFGPSGLKNPVVQWALTRFLIQGADGRYERRFKKLGLGVTGSKLSGAELTNSFAEYATLMREFDEFLAIERQSLIPATGHWEERFDAVLANSGKSIWSLARSNQPMNTITVSVTPTAALRVGLILEWNGPFDAYRVLLVHGERVLMGMIDHDRFTLEREYESGVGLGDSIRLRAERSGHELSLWIAEERVDDLRVHSRSMGLVCGRGRTVFRDLSWE
jgi:hypothetical protein